MMSEPFTIVIPAKNESSGLTKLLPELTSIYKDAEIIVVNDGSNDNTSEICQANGVKEIAHPYSKGNGAAVKAGARSASHEILLFMDADGQHQVKDIAPILEMLRSGYDMVVGARSAEGQANKHRYLANAVYNKVASLMVGHKVKDLTSGMRAVKKSKFIEFIDLLPNGFSYPTTSTMAFFRAGYSVGYVPIDVLSRDGKSHIDIKKDGIRFLLIIFKIATLYSPLKLFFPLSLAFFLLGVVYYLFTFFTMGRFTNMSALLFTTSILVFLMGLVSEQVTTLTYLSGKNREDDNK
ncbi:glycosyltransferase family 2 protein [Halioxenophilus sp. WMMB6]|uniref:glycosyltransferase family 2 protein n=1 Tax=Halioxenophilus sp. WMMB6 TaxID=3073815 RepID=UPI00295EE042|nr:glycosyltransferase family 2 protein [Halioxenophilus sp. WMMB6]